MHQTFMSIIVAAAVGTMILAPLTASAAMAKIVPGAPVSAVHTVQYWSPAPYDGGWERRQAWREWRRERDEARIAEAARRAAWQIKQEREQRRAWREQQHGYDPHHGHGW